jgi:hypothetical protein
VKRVIRALLVGAMIVASLGFLTMATYGTYLAMLLWPGFLLVNYVYRLLGFSGIAFSDFGWILWPALLVNTLLYAALFFVVVTWRRRRSDASGQDRLLQG